MRAVFTVCVRVTSSELRRKPKKGGVVKAINASRATMIASNLVEASGYLSRLKGLIGRDRLDHGEGLWMVRCGAIHTFGMRFPIDVVFLDRDMNVRKAEKEVPPSRLAVFCPGACSVIELPAGTIEKARVHIGDIVQIIRFS